MSLREPRTETDMFTHVSSQTGFRSFLCVCVLRLPELEWSGSRQRRTYGSDRLSESHAIRFLHVYHTRYNTHKSFAQDVPNTLVAIYIFQQLRELRSNLEKLSIITIRKPLDNYRQFFKAQEAPTNGLIDRAINWHGCMAHSFTHINSNYYYKLLNFILQPT